MKRWKEWKFMVTVRVMEGISVNTLELVDYIRYRLNLRDHLKLSDVCLLSESDDFIEEKEGV